MEGPEDIWEKYKDWNINDDRIETTAEEIERHKAIDRKVKGEDLEKRMKKVEEMEEKAY